MSCCGADTMKIMSFLQMKLKSRSAPSPGLPIIIPTESEHILACVNSNSVCKGNKICWNKLIKFKIIHDISFNFYLTLYYHL